MIERDIIIWTYFMIIHHIRGRKFWIKGRIQLYCESIKSSCRFLFLFFWMNHSDPHTHHNPQNKTWTQMFIINSNCFTRVCVCFMFYHPYRNHPGFMCHQDEKGWERVGAWDNKWSSWSDHWMNTTLFFSHAVKDPRIPFSCHWWFITCNHHYDRML